MSLILGIDLGGTKSAALVATPEGEILYRVAGSTPAQGGSETVIPFLIGLAKDALSHAPGQVERVGVSAGAPADAVRGIVFTAPNLPGWGGTDGVPLTQILSDALDGLPVHLENDADATALAEWRYGAGRGTQTMAFLTMGTGIGSGLILNGRLHRGAFGAGGEIGHIAVVPDGRLCKCGFKGCLEAYASGPSVTRIAVEQGYTGEPTGRAVVEAARAGEPAALFALTQAGEMLGRGLATLTMLLNPERIVLGTLVVHAGDLLLPTIRRSFLQHTWPRLSQGVTVVPAKLGDRAQDLAAMSAALSE